MKKFYYLSEEILDSWQLDLDLQESKSEPSKKVLDTILDYAQSTDMELYSILLKQKITLSIN